MIIDQLQISLGNITRENVANDETKVANREQITYNNYMEDLFIRLNLHIVFKQALSDNQTLPLSNDNICRHLVKKNNDINGRTLL